MSWKSATLKDLVFFQRGFDITKAEQNAGDIPVISSSGISSYHNEAKVAGPGIVIGRKGTLGSVFYSEKDFWPHDTTLWSKDLNGNNARFVFYFLKTLKLENYNVGNANPTLNRNHIHDLKIAIPPLPTQNSIADILSAYYDLIENNRRRMALLEESARLLYREWFVHLRFPGHEHVPVKDGVPKGWKILPLDEIAKTNAESFPAKELPDEICYIDISSVKTGFIHSNTIMDAKDAPGRARRKVHHGDVIWSNVRPNLRAYALIIEPNPNFVISTGFTVLTATSVPFTYLYCLVTTDTFVNHLINNATGVGYPAVRPPDFERAMVMVPETSILHTFHETTEPIFLARHILEKEIKALEQARELLLPRLMSGEIAV
jgi:type I restriction enzyme S subunit